MDIINSFTNLIPITLAQGLIYAFIALGIMIPFRVLNFPDLTCEGSFPLGGCLCVSLITSGIDPFAATVIAVLGGFSAGCVTAYIHLKLKINTLLAGILVLTMLFSINLRIMGRSNVSLIGEDNALDDVLAPIIPLLGSIVSAEILFFAVTLAVAGTVLLLFFGTEIGMSMRAVGANLKMASAQGINTWTYTIVGLGLANMLNALAGAVLAQQQGYADVNMGLGILIDGLAALIIGEAIIGRQTIWRQVAAPVIGAVAYYQLISLGLAADLEPSDLKLATGIFVLIMLGLPALRGGGVAEVLKIRE